MVLQWCYNGVTMVLQWCYNGVTMVLQWCYNGVTMVLQWCYNGVTMVLQGPVKTWKSCEVRDGSSVGIARGDFSR
jgi:hypothetical protein